LRIVIIVGILLQSCIASAQTFSNRVVVGAEQMDSYIPLLKNKKVALLVNQTSMVKGRHLVDTLLASKINIVKIFAPEHGFRGTADAGEKIKSGIDAKTGVAISSMYGANKKPSAESM
jgi:uncharacterized protein YbbC (DUF1343 family)